MSVAGIALWLKLDCPAAAAGATAAAWGFSGSHPSLRRGQPGNFIIEMRAKLRRFC